MPTANWSVISHGRHIIHDIIHINTYISESAVSQSDTHAAYTMDIADIHVHATVYLYNYFHAFYFKRFNSFSLKLLSADGMFIFMNTLVAYGPL